MPPKRAGSSETPVPTTEGAEPDGSALPDEQWKGMTDVLNHIYNFRLQEYVRFQPSHCRDEETTMKSADILQRL